MLITFLASFLIWILFLGVFLLWFLDDKFNRESLFHVIAASIVAWAFSESIKYMFPSLRPFQISGIKPEIFRIPLDSAFPSSHAAVSFAMAMSVSKYNKKVGKYYILGAVLIGIARVLSHVHFYIDILGGALIGILVAQLLDSLHTEKVIK